MRRALALALLLLVQDPDYIGPEDPAHQGQPRTCSNSPKITAVKRDCACQKPTCRPDAMEDAKCLVYCRKPACKCRHEHCETE